MFEIKINEASNGLIIPEFDNFWDICEFVEKHLGRRCEWRTSADAERIYTAEINSAGEPLAEINAFFEI